MIVVAFLASASFLLDADGSLGTDTGGKIATINAMEARGDWTPSLGYWAEASDPTGSAHPFFGTTRREAGWINVTSLPMIMATRPLVGLFGSLGFLILPIAGSVLACLAAGELGGRFGARSWKTGFWVAASCSPVAVYGLDFWEHSIGLALMIGGVVSVLTTFDSGCRTHLWAASSGLCFGVAATMRTESLVFGFVAGIVCLLGGPTTSTAARISRSAVMAFAALVPLVANQIAEASVYGDALRSDRAAAAVASTTSTGLLQRLQEGILITASPINLVHPLSMVMAALVAVGLVWLGWALLNDTDPTRPAVLCGLALLLVFLRLVTFGPTFVPGMLAAVPAAGLGISALLRDRNRAIAVLVLGPIPLVWATQYPGAAEAQWAGRYILTSGVVLAVYGSVVVSRTKPKLVIGFLAANVFMSVLGISYLVNRTHDFGAANRSVARIDGVVVFTESFLAREAAPLGWDKPWLGAGDDSQRTSVVGILDENGIDQFTLIASPEEGSPTFAGFAPETSTRELSYGQLTMIELTYVRDSD
jgi:hypothetical protein